MTRFNPTVGAGNPVAGLGLVTRPTKKVLRALWLRQVRKGSAVLWLDPEHAHHSGQYRVERIHTALGTVTNAYTILTLRAVDGKLMEVLAEEIHIP